MTVGELLDLLRAQDGAMLGRKSAEVLSSFLEGFTLARKQDGYPADEDYLDTFNRWVARKFKNEGGQGWAKLVAFYSSGEADEWKLFWKLHDEYVDKQVRKRPPAVGARS